MAKVHKTKRSIVRALGMVMWCMSIENVQVKSSGRLSIQSQNSNSVRCQKCMRKTSCCHNWPGGAADATLARQEEDREKHNNHSTGSKTETPANTENEA